jgi:hypothetical protein
VVSILTVIATAIATWGITYWQMTRMSDDEFSKLKVGSIVDEKLQPILEKIQKQGEDIAKIKGADGIANNAVPPALNAVLQNVSEAMKSKPTAAELNNIAVQLSEAQKSFAAFPAVWQTTGGFINYKANFLVPSAPAIQAKATGVPCQRSLGGEGEVFRNCEINLESVDIHTVNVIINGRPVAFINCLVHYHGGQLQTKGPIIFQNSVLRFDVSSVPPPAGINVMKQLTLAMVENGQIRLSP